MEVTAGSSAVAATMDDVVNGNRTAPGADPLPDHRDGAAQAHIETRANVEGAWDTRKRKRDDEGSIRAPDGRELREFTEQELTNLLLSPEGRRGRLKGAILTVRGRLRQAAAAAGKGAENDGAQAQNLRLIDAADSNGCHAPPSGREVRLQREPRVREPRRRDTTEVAPPAVIAMGPPPGDATQTLRISGLTLPVHAAALRAALDEHAGGGAVLAGDDGMYVMDAAARNSRVYATFDAVSSAVAAASAFHDKQWPSGRGKRLLITFCAETATQVRASASNGSRSVDGGLAEAEEAARLATKAARRAFDDAMTARKAALRASRDDSERWTAVDPVYGALPAAGKEPLVVLRASSKEPLITARRKAAAAAAAAVAADADVLKHGSGEVGTEDHGRSAAIAPAHDEAPSDLALESELRVTKAVDDADAAAVIDDDPDDYPGPVVGGATLDDLFFKTTAAPSLYFLARGNAAAERRRAHIPAQLEALRARGDAEEWPPKVEVTAADAFRPLADLTTTAPIGGRDVQRQRQEQHRRDGGAVGERRDRNREYPRRRDEILPPPPQTFGGGVEWAGGVGAHAGWGGAPPYPPPPPYFDSSYTDYPGPPHERPRYAPPDRYGPPPGPPPERYAPPDRYGPPPGPPPERYAPSERYGPPSRLPPDRYGPPPGPPSDFRESQSSSYYAPPLGSGYDMPRPPPLHTGSDRHGYAPMSLAPPQFHGGGDGGLPQQQYRVGGGLMPPHQQHFGPPPRRSGRDDDEAAAAGAYFRGGGGGGGGGAPYTPSSPPPAPYAPAYYSGGGFHARDGSQSAAGNGPGPGPVGGGARLDRE